MQGKAWAPICRAAANLGVRARGWETGEISGEYRARALWEEGEETGVWGHGISGSGRSRALRSQAPTGGPGGAVRVALAGERGRAVRGVERGRGDALAAWEQAGACGPGVRAGRSGRGELGRAGGSGPSERGVSWAGERKGRLGCCWAGVGPREGRGRPGLRWVWGLLGLGLGWVKGLGFLFPTLLLPKSNSSKV